MPKIFHRNHLPSEQCRCDAHGGIAYFLQYVKLSKCNMDWDTEKVVCPRCKALLQPPQSLLLFSLDVRSSHFLMTYFICRLIFSSQVNVLELLLVITPVYFILFHIIPGLIASLCAWEPIDLRGQPLEEWLEDRRTAIGRDKFSWRRFLIRLGGTMAMTMLSISIVYCFFA